MKSVTGVEQVKIEQFNLNWTDLAIETELFLVWTTFEQCGYWMLWIFNALEKSLDIECSGQSCSIWMQLVVSKASFSALKHLFVSKASFLALKQLLGLKTTLRRSKCSNQNIFLNSKILAWAHRFTRKCYPIESNQLK